MPRENKIKFNFIELGRCSFTFNNDKGMINIYNDIVLPLIKKYECEHLIDMIDFEVLFSTISRCIPSMTLLPNKKYENYFLHVSNNIAFVDDRSKEDKKELSYISSVMNEKVIFTNVPYLIEGHNSKQKASELYEKMNNLLNLLDDEITKHLINFKSSLLTFQDYEEIVGIS